MADDDDWVPIEPDPDDWVPVIPDPEPPFEDIEPDPEHPEDEPLDEGGYGPTPDQTAVSA